MGAFDSICAQCNAVLFSGEKFNCCLDGKVRPPALSEYPDELKDLLTSNSARGNGFRKLIRVHNNLFSFASMSAQISDLHLVMALPVLESVGKFAIGTVRFYLPKTILYNNCI